MLIQTLSETVSPSFIILLYIHLSVELHHAAAGVVTDRQTHKHTHTHTGTASTVSDFLSDAPFFNLESFRLLARGQSSHKSRPKSLPNPFVA